MYVCVCNGFTDGEARLAIRQAGARSIAAVYRKLECRPVCGKCKPTLRDMIGAESERAGTGPNDHP
jgi:bacterioferritin-associated ferredoxin